MLTLRLVRNQLYSPNSEFWKSRQGMPDPRSSFTDKLMKAEIKVQDAALAASNKLHDVKERALGRS
ncbi:hypothetical protein FS749_009887 [Ceratobasidium sp. UAMH 11750]|nr:hypothetical protein FS749_009887 [Ceratobasidium sp. UAMH 11750]